MNTGPSLYDKYFDINMEDLNIALCTIPFYERNSIAETNFSQTDILTMNNRSTRFKQKYFNDKSYSTPETDAQDKILNNLRESMKDDHEKDRDTTNDIEIKYDSKNKTVPETEPTPVLATDIDLEFKNKTKTKPADNNSIKNIEKVIFKQEATINKIEPIPKSNIEKVVENIDDSIFGDTNKPTKELKDVAETPDLADKLVCHTINAPEGDSKETTVLEANELPTHPSITPTIPQHTVTTVTPIVPKTEAAVHKGMYILSQTIFCPLYFIVSHVIYICMLPPNLNIVTERQVNIVTHNHISRVFESADWSQFSVLDHLLRTVVIQE